MKRRRRRRRRRRRTKNNSDLVRFAERAARNLKTLGSLKSEFWSYSCELQSFTSESWILILNPCLGFPESWILNPYLWLANIYIWILHPDPESWIPAWGSLNPESWIPTCDLQTFTSESWILILNPESLPGAPWIPNPYLWLANIYIWILRVLILNPEYLHGVPWILNPDTWNLNTYSNV